jgi:hypothetical protein
MKALLYKDYGRLVAPPRLAIYDEVLSILVKIINNPTPWLLKR